MAEVSARKWSTFLPDYKSLLALVCLPLSIVVLFMYGRYGDWNARSKFLHANWGNVASLWGLAVGIYVLVVAQGARRAAENTAELFRKRSLVEELEDVDRKIQQVGVFIRNKKWDLVNHVAVEVLAACSASAARWGDLPEASANELLTAVTIIRSIADVAGRLREGQPNERDQRLISKAHLDAMQKLSATLGHCRQLSERKAQ